MRHSLLALSAAALISLCCLAPTALAGAHGRVSAEEAANETGLIQGHGRQVLGFAQELRTLQNQCISAKAEGENVIVAFTKIVGIQVGTFFTDEKKLFSAELKWAEGLDKRSDAYKKADNKQLVREAGHQLALAIAHFEDALRAEGHQAEAFTSLECEEVSELEKAESQHATGERGLKVGVDDLMAAVKDEP